MPVFLGLAFYVAHAHLFFGAFFHLIGTLASHTLGV